MTVTTTATATAPLTLTVEELRTAKGALKARKAIAAGTPLTVRITGPEAFLAGTAITRTADAGAGADTAAGVVDGGATVVITIAVIAGLVAIAGLGVVATVCILGINAGYRVEAVHRIRSKTTIFDDELTIILVPPSPAV